MRFQRRASPLHAARAAVACAWCAALAAAALSTEHPLVLGVLLGCILVASMAAGVGGPVLRWTLRVGLPLALLIALVNPFVVREGLTVIARLGEVPVLGRLDLTLEATAYGAILGLRALVVVACFALYATAVDPDAVLRLFRRVGFRSALTATLGTRMVDVLASDARRLRDGQRCRAGEPASRVAVVRAVAGGALDRATDVAAALELRGYGSARRAGGAGFHRPWSRHDIAFLAAAGGLVALTVGGVAGNAAEFTAYPRLEATGGAAPLLLASGLAACALLPFADRRGIA